MNNTPQDTACSAYASPLKKGGLRGIYLRWRELTTIVNPPTPFPKGGFAKQAVTGGFEDY